MIIFDKRGHFVHNINLEYRPVYLYIQNVYACLWGQKYLPAILTLLHGALYISRGVSTLHTEEYTSSESSRVFFKHY